MANVHVISYRILDDQATSGTVNVYVPATATLAEVQAFSDQFAAHLDAITGGKIDSASVALALTLPAVKASPIADHFIQAGSNWSFDAANTGYRFTLHVPAVDHGIVTGGAIDTSPQYVVDFIADLVSGTAALDPSDRYANDLTGFLGASLSFRK